MGILSHKGIWGWKSISYKRESPQRRDMEQRSQMRLELLLLMSVKGQSDTQPFEFFCCIPVCQMKKMKRLHTKHV